MTPVFRFFVFCITLLFMLSCGEDRQQPVHMYSLNNPAETGSRYANLYQDDTGSIYMSWLEYIEEDIYALRYAVYDNEQWGPAQSIRVATDFFVNWADFPSVTGLSGEPVAAHWLKKIEGGPYAYNVEIAFPDADTGRWTNVITPHQDGTATEHGFVSMEPLSEDTVLAIWLDGRNTEGREHHQYEDISQAMTLRSAEISSSGEISREREIDNVVCDCCQTDLIAVDGGYLAVYRGRTEDEIRDIRITRYDLETGEWSEPAKVHEDGWKIMACPVNGPRILANGDHVAVTWYTGADDEPRVLLARSTDGGNTFEDPITVADAELGTVGRPDLILTEEGTIYVSWLQQRGGLGNVMISRILPNGSLGQETVVGLTASTRSSGFPRMKKTDDSIIISWTQTEPLVRVRTARVGLEMF